MHNRTRWTRLAPAGAAAILTLGATALPPSARAAGGAGTVPGPSDWPAFGHDIHHSFTGVTSLTPGTAATLAPAWFFQTGAAVTANPIVVRSTVYFGSWDGYFYAVDRSGGSLRWKYRLKDQPAVSPQPGNPQPDPVTDGGLVTASAWFQPGSSRRPDLVIFAGGYTLYALNAGTGQLYWSHDYTGRPDLPPDPAHDGTRIFSSPVVAGNKVLVGVSSDGGAGRRGYFVAASLTTGMPVWEFQTDVDTTGAVQNDGCGGVWSSPSVDEVRHLVSFGVADCNLQGTPPYNQRVLALHVSDGSLAWVFTPPRLRGVPAGKDPACDFDFGATANLGSPDARTGAPTFLGIGGKDGTYYRLDPATGALRWASNVVFGGFSGGFIGTTAYDGSRVYGATGFGMVGASPNSSCPQTSDPRYEVQDPSLHAFNASGGVAWQQDRSQSVGATTVAGGMTFVGLAATPQVQVRNGASGDLVRSLPLAAPCFCAVSVSGNAVFVGTGAPQQGSGDGVYAFTPLAAPPSP
jgi:polyvinyl alcohol dehydrogenase (cytochrome)